MSLSTVLAPLYDPARRRPPPPPQQLRPRPYAQRVNFPRAPAGPLVARMPSHFANRVIKQVGVIGRDSQRLAMELKNYLARKDSDSATIVKIGSGNDRRSSARDAGFTEEDGTLGDIPETVTESDILWLTSMPDFALQEFDYATAFAPMKRHSILAVSGCSGLRHMETLAVDNERNIIAVHVDLAKMGRFVQDLNIEALQINGAGTSFSLPVHQEEELPAFPGRTTLKNFGTCDIGGNGSGWRTVIHGSQFHFDSPLGCCLLTVVL